MTATLTIDPISLVQPEPRRRDSSNSPPVQRPDSEKLVDEYYQPLFRFAYSLAKNEPDAVDLVQQTFLRWAQKGHQLRDVTKVKSWLFTTLHREFLGGRRRLTKFPNVELEKVESELPNIAPNVVDSLDASIVTETLKKVDERFRAALSLFYFNEYSYKEIAEALEIPIGTVMSRISRGKTQLRGLLASSAKAGRLTD